MIFKFIWKRKFIALAFAIVTIIAVISSTLFSIHIADVFDAVELGDYTALLKIFALMFFWYISYRLIEFYAETIGIYFINAVRKDIKEALFDSIIQKKIPFFTERNSGEYIAEFTNDITMIETKFLIPLKEMVLYIITIITAGAAIYTIDIRMALVIIAGLIICMLLSIFTSKFTSSKMLRFVERFDKFVQYLKDTFGAFFTFKNYAVENKIQSRFDNENHEVETIKYSAEQALVIMNALIGRVAWMVELVVVLFGLLGVIQGELKIGVVFSAYLIAGQLGQPMQSVGNRISMIRSIKGIERKFNYLFEMDERVTETDTIAETGNMDIIIKNVSLEIKGKKILNDISFTFQHGKKYLIMGSNGSGKSTIAKLLKNTYASYDGAVVYGTHSLRTSVGELLSQQVSYSNEMVSLLSDTVKNNILLYRDIDEEVLQKAMADAALTVPLDRNIGDNGKHLSSGERRKLEIARALVSKPQILIFDEVVSTLDIETAFEIEKLTLGLDNTVIAISNAFSGQLLDKYDAIIIMSHGRIIASGTHSELIEQSQEYCEIYKIRCGINQLREG